MSILKNIVKNIPASIYWKDKNSIILGGSHLHAELAGYLDSKEVIGKSDYEFFWKGQAEQILENDQFVINSNKTFIFEEIGKLADGNTYTFLTKKSPLKNKSGEAIGVLGISLDITELKETQKKLELLLKKAEIANQAKTKFLENICHDICTSLSDIVDCSQLIKMESGLPKKVVEFVDYLVNSSDSLMGLLNMTLASITDASSEIPLIKKNFDLKESLEHIISLNKSQALLKGLGLSLDYEKTIPANLIGDPIRVQRIMLELLTSALKFTSKGEIKVSACLFENRSNDMLIELGISNIGIGSALDTIHEVYTRFKRLTPSYQGIYEGTGLGLSLVKQFIDDLNGEIYIDSDVGKGAKFTCLISFKKPMLMSIV